MTYGLSLPVLASPRGERFGDFPYQNVTPTASCSMTLSDKTLRAVIPKLKSYGFHAGGSSQSGYCSG